jgi:hypothetical protein
MTGATGAKPALRLPVEFVEFGQPVQLPIRVTAMRVCPALFAKARVLAAAHRCLAVVCLALLAVLTGTATVQAQATNASPPASRLIETAGRVEFLATGRTNWQAATNGLALQPGDRVRTHERSRAALQLSDRSVIRWKSCRRAARKRSASACPAARSTSSTARSPPTSSSTRRSLPERFAARNSYWRSPLSSFPSLPSLPLVSPCWTVS